MSSETQSVLSCLSLNTATNFPKFSLLPLEIRRQIWSNSLPGPRVHPLRGYPVSIFPRLPRFPPAVRSVLHATHESRTETLNHYKLLLFPIRVGPQHTLSDVHKSKSPSHISKSWPAPKSGERQLELELRWESRGCFTVNVRSDLVFFGRWATRDLVRLYRSDFCPSLIFALSEVRYLSISMHSWRESKDEWLAILLHLDKLQEVVFVREFLKPSSLSSELKLRLLDLEEMDVAVHEFSGEVWRARILADVERQKGIWPTWRVPKLDFKAITDSCESGRMVMDLRTRRLRPGDSWRRDRNLWATLP